MAPTDRPLDNPINWSFKVGRLWAIDIRVHIIFVLAAVVLVWMELPREGSGDPRSFGEAVVDALGIYAILFSIVLLHEFGHCWGARRVGGEADEIMLWPLGGLAYVSPPHNARAHMVTALSGPMVNVIICGVLSGVLTLWMESLGAVPWNPLHPMWPADASIIPTTAQLWTIRVFGISYFLLLINLLPIFPFDGGRMLQAWLWPAKGYAASMQVATSTGMIGAITLGLFGLFAEQSWLLLMIAVFGYLTCWKQRRMLKEQGEFGGGEFGYDFSRGYASLDQWGDREVRPGPIARWRQKRATARAERRRRAREAHERDVERILGKISAAGMDALTPAERRILEKETERQRTGQSADR